MIVAVMLFGYAALTATATRLLRRPWVTRAPRLAIALWQLALATVVGATVLGLLVLTVPVAAGSGLAALIHACVMALSAGYGGPFGGRLVFLFGLGLTGTLLLRLGGCLAGELWYAARGRRRHLRALALLGSPEASGITVVDHAGHAVYCVPGRRGRIVLSTATLAALDADQLDGVLAHERAHLSGRHDLILASARALARAFPLPVFRTAVRELATLVEMLADDAVRTAPQRLILATALVRLATGAPTPTVAALAAATTGVLARVNRLRQPAQPLPRRLTVTLTLAGLVAATIPVLIALIPAALAATLAYCSVSTG